MRAFFVVLFISSVLLSGGSLLKKNYQRFQIFIICADAFSILHEMLGVKPGRIFHASMGLRLLPFFQNHIKDEAENTGDKGNGIGKEENRW